MSTLWHWKSSLWQFLCLPAPCLDILKAPLPVSNLVAVLLHKRVQVHLTQHNPVLEAIMDTFQTLKQKFSLQNKAINTQARTESLSHTKQFYFQE